jgi:hypothetical protein
MYFTMDTNNAVARFGNEEIVQTASAFLRSSEVAHRFFPAYWL